MLTDTDRNTYDSSADPLRRKPAISAVDAAGAYSGSPPPTGNPGGEPTPAPRTAPTNIPGIPTPAAPAPTPAAAPAPATTPTTTSTASTSFRSLRESGLARPAPAFTAGSYQPQDNSALRAQLMGMFTNPNSAYGSEQVMDAYRRGSEDIDDSFSLQQAKAREDMVARGLSDSSIAGGRYADLNVGRRTAGTELMDSLLREKAKSDEDAKGRALAQMLQLAGIDQQGALGAAQIDATREGNYLQSQYQFESLSQSDIESLRRLGLDTEELDFRRGQETTRVDQWGKEFDENKDQFTRQLDQNDMAALMNFLGMMGLDGFGSAETPVARY